MGFQLPEDFQKYTRWVYLKNHAEYGPFTAGEILSALRDLEITPDTILRELESSRSGPVTMFKPFAEYLVILEEERSQLQLQREYETHRTRLKQGRRWGRHLLFAGVPAVLALGVVLVLFPHWFLGAGGGVRVIQGGSGSGSAADPRQEEAREHTPTETAAEQILEPESEDERLAREAARLAAEQAAAHLGVSGGEEHQWVSRNQRVERTAVEPPPEPRRPRRSRARASGGEQGGQASSGESQGMMVMSFMDDDDEETSEALARERLAEALARCTRQVAAHYGDVPEYSTTARAVLAPSGSLGRLSVQAEPHVYVADLRTCLSARLLAIEVPPFDGPAVSIQVRARERQSP